MVKLEVRKNAYFDSVTLMIISKDVKKLPGVKEALVGMGTDLNREIAEKIGLAGEGFPEWVNTVFGSSSVVVATILAIILNLTLPKEKQSK